MPEQNEAKKASSGKCNKNHTVYWHGLWICSTKLRVVDSISAFCRDEEKEQVQCNFNIKIHRDMKSSKIRQGVKKKKAFLECFSIINNANKTCVPHSCLNEHTRQYVMIFSIYFRPNGVLNRIIDYNGIHQINVQIEFPQLFHFCNDTIYFHKIRLVVITEILTAGRKQQSDERVGQATIKLLLLNCCK